MIDDKSELKRYKKLIEDSDLPDIAKKAKKGEGPPFYWDITRCAIWLGDSLKQNDLKDDQIQDIVFRFNYDVYVSTDRDEIWQKARDILRDHSDD